MAKTNLENLINALEGVELTPLEAECPKGYYMVDLLIARAIIEPHALLRNERDLLDVIRGWPELRAILEENNPGHTTYILLGNLIGSQGVALRMMAALVTLRRAQLLTLLTAAELLKEQFPVGEDLSDTALFTRKEAKFYAEAGYLGILDTNLDPDPSSIYLKTESK